MVEINLLPWRHYKRTYEKKVVKKLLLISFLTSVVATLAIHVGLMLQLNNKKSDLRELKEEINRMSAFKAPSQHVNMQPLQQSAFTKNLIEVLASRHQGSVCFKGIKRENKVVTFHGQARSAVDLTDFLQNWRAVKLFSEIKIDYLKADPRKQLMMFRFHAMENES